LPKKDWKAGQNAVGSKYLNYNKATDKKSSVNYRRNRYEKYQSRICALKESGKNILNIFTLIGDQVGQIITFRAIFTVKSDYTLYA
jgi:hypothetical protein